MGERREVKESFCVKYNEKVLIFLASWVFGLVGRITYRSIKCFLVVPLSRFYACVKPHISLHYHITPFF